MRIWIILGSIVGCSKLASADVGPLQGGSTVGDSGTAYIAPTWNPDLSRGVQVPSYPGAGTYIPAGSSLRSSSQTRDGVDSLGGLDGIPEDPEVLGSEREFPENASEMLAPALNAVPSTGSTGSDRSLDPAQSP